MDQNGVTTPEKKEAHPGAAKPFLISEAFRFGWQTTKSNLGFFFLIFVIIFAVNSLFQFLTNSMDNTFFLFLLSLISFGVQLLLDAGIIKIGLKFASGLKAKIADLFSAYDVIFTYFFASVLYGLIVAGGLILFIIPGIMWAVRFNLYSYLILDKKMGALAALKESSRLTAGVRWDLLGFIILAALLNLAGFAALIIGLLFTVPTTLVAHASIYRKLSQRASTAPVVSSTPPLETAA